MSSLATMVAPPAKQANAGDITSTQVVKTDNTAKPTATPTPKPSPTHTPKPSPTPIPTPTPTPVPVQQVQPTQPPAPQPTQPPVVTGVNGNPWSYDFNPGNYIYSPPGSFCSYFSCIANFWNGNGYVMQCQDGMYSKSGGIRGSCSRHGGNAQPLFSH